MADHLLGLEAELVLRAELVLERRHLGHQLVLLLLHPVHQIGE